MDDSLKTNRVQKKLWRFWKMILNLIVIQKRFWKDDIEKVKINIMENSLKTNFVQKKMWRFFKDDTELNCDTKIFVVRKLVILLFFTFSMLSFQNSVSSLKNFCSFFWTLFIFKESSIMLIFTFSMSSFQNRFCIMIKVSIIFSESSQFLLSKIRLEHPGNLSKLDGITRGMMWLERYRLNKSPYLYN